MSDGAWVRIDRIPLRAALRYPARALMASLLEHLGGFVSALSAGQKKPQRKFLADAMAGVLGARSPLLSEWARTLGEDAFIESTITRLSRNLGSDRLDFDAVQHAYREQVARFTRANEGRGVVVGIDYSDLSKPYANPDENAGMEHVTTCWDGSKGSKGLGIPMAIAEAHLPTGERIPLDWHAFSFKEPGHLSQTNVFLDRLKVISHAVGPHGRYVLDRGFHGRAYLDGMDELGLRWCVRLRLSGYGQRSLVDANGERLMAGEHALQAIPRYVYKMPTGRRRQKHRTHTRIEIGARKVFIALEHGKVDPTPRLLVVAWGLGKDPIALLCSEYEAGRAGALSAFKDYGRRWEAEESMRQASQRTAWGFDLESVLVYRFKALRRLVALVAMAQGFLGMMNSKPVVRERMLRLVKMLRKAHRKDMGYALARAIGQVIERTARPVLAAWRMDPDPSPDGDG